MKQSLVRSIIISIFAIILAACGGGNGDTAPDEPSISSPPIAQCPILSENDALLETCDSDTDGVDDSVDEFPLDKSESFDFDGDGVGDNADTDDDNDAWSDNDEIECSSDPLNTNSQPKDNDNDHQCDELDLDDDNDGVIDIDDPFPNDAYKIKLPKGIFSSHTEGFTVDSLDNPEARGGLIRVEWETIEPEPGEFNFSEIDLLVQDMKDRKQMWSLGVRTSFHSPTWLAEKLGAEYFEFEFDEDFLEQNPDTITSWPKPWDPVVQDRLRILVDELAARYNTDADLGLVYISQMASIGIEGHFIGVTEGSLAENGVTEESWVNISVATAEMFAAAFTNKALAFEIHDILFSPNAAIRIIDSLWENPELHYRIGAAMWWLSGKTSYQPELLAFMESFEGPIYAQLIGKSSQPQRFENDEFTSVFDQADQLGIRYIEIWNNDMVISDWDENYALFNEQVDARYSETNAEYIDTDID